MGAGAAATIPSGLSIVNDLFRRPAERARAVGVWSGTIGLGIAVGPVAGGLLLSRFWWGSIFLVNVPVVVVGIVGAMVFGPRVPRPRRPTARSARRRPHHQRPRPGPVGDHRGPGPRVDVALRTRRPPRGPGGDHWVPSSGSTTVITPCCRSASFAHADSVSPSWPSPWGSSPFWGGCSWRPSSFSSPWASRPSRPGCASFPSPWSSLSERSPPPRSCPPSGTKLTAAAGLGLITGGLVQIAAASSVTADFPGSSRACCSWAWAPGC